MTRTGHHRGNLSLWGSGPSLDRHQGGRGRQRRRKRSGSALSRRLGGRRGRPRSSRVPPSLRLRRRPHLSGPTPPSIRAPPLSASPPNTASPQLPCIAIAIPACLSWSEKLSVRRVMHNIIPFSRELRVACCGRAHYLLPIPARNSDASHPLFTLLSLRTWLLFRKEEKRVSEERHWHKGRRPFATS